MSDVLRQLLPLAAVVAFNPLPVIAIILVLQTSQGRRAGSAFAGAWLVALLALGGIAILIANQTDLYGSGSSSAVARVIRAAVGLMLVVLAVRKWTGRPRAGEEATAPAWMDALASTTPAKSARLGALLAAGNPKNIAVTLAAAAAIVEAGLSVGLEATALVFFTVASTLGIAVPLLARLALGDRGDAVLASWARWLTRHNSVVMALVLLVIGVLLVAGAITG
jgi:threonine/homoserine/homoserine lactone efflux protein